MQIFNILAIFCNWADLIEFNLVGNPKDRFSRIKIYYVLCSKILNTSSLPKRPKQTVQIQIRLLHQKQSDQGLPCLLFWQDFC